MKPFNCSKEGFDELLKDPSKIRKLKLGSKAGVILCLLNYAKKRDIHNAMRVAVATNNDTLIILMAIQLRVKYGKLAFRESLDAGDAVYPKVWPRVCRTYNHLKED